MQAFPFQRFWLTKIQPFLTSPDPEHYSSGAVLFFFNSSYIWVFHSLCYRVSVCVNILLLISSWLFFLLRSAINCFVPSNCSASTHLEPVVSSAYIALQLYLLLSEPARSSVSVCLFLSREYQTIHSYLSPTALLSPLVSPPANKLFTLSLPQIPKPSRSSVSVCVH